jgi:hypothetical protein
MDIEKKYPREGFRMHIITLDSIANEIANDIDNKAVNDIDRLKMEINAMRYYINMLHDIYSKKDIK